MIKELDRRLKVIDRGGPPPRRARGRGDARSPSGAHAERQAERARRRVARGLPPEPSRRPASGAEAGDASDDDRRVQQAEVSHERHAETTAARRPRGARGARKDDKGASGRRGMFRRRRVCKFCAEHIDHISYKDVKLLAQFIPERGKIQPRRLSGTCATHQRSCRPRSSGRGSSR